MITWGKKHKIELELIKIELIEMYEIRFTRSKSDLQLIVKLF